MSKSKSFNLGRSAITGKFKTVAQARQQPRTSVVERIAKRGPEKKK